MPVLDGWIHLKHTQTFVQMCLSFSVAQNNRRFAGANETTTLMLQKNPSCDTEIKGTNRSRSNLFQGLSKITVMPLDVH